MKKNQFCWAFALLSIFCMTQVLGQPSQVAIGSFEKVIVSPHIEVTFIQGDSESVTIEKARLPIDKLNVEVVGHTLRIYLDGAKIVTGSEKEYNGNRNGKRALYDGTMASVTVTYKRLKNLSVRGEEIVRVHGPLQEKDLKLSIFGESKVYVDNLIAEDLTVAIYGSSYLEITDGAVNHQLYRAYGESEVNAMKLKNKSTKITAYGESNFRVKVSDRLKINCYGEATINYFGDPVVEKGVVIGEASIHKML